MNAVASAKEIPDPIAEQIAEDLADPVFRAELREASDRLERGEIEDYVAHEEAVRSLGL